MSNIVGAVQSAPDTFSSWDKCMAKSYCKWPAIAGIVIGSLILLSVLFCLVQCLCCGVSCAKMLCCCCRGCGRSKRDKPSRYKDDYQHMPPTPYSGYQPTPDPMTYRGAPASTATFDASSNKKINDDSLPAMPSWDTAQTRRIEEIQPEKHHEDVEMGRLAPIQTPPQRMFSNGYNQVPNGPISPTSPTHPQNSYFGTHPQNTNSDLGAQRMGAYDYDDTPHSPAPTYTTNPPATDRFVAGAASAAPYSYQNKHPETTYAPSSTQYQASDFGSMHNTYAPQPSPYQSHSHSTSPPAMHGASTAEFWGNSYNYSPYGNGNGSVSPPAIENSGARPPSLLMIGRKAVPGSQREV